MISDRFIPNYAKLANRRQQSFEKILEHERHIATNKSKFSGYYEDCMETYVRIFRMTAINGVILIMTYGGLAGGSSVILTKDEVCLAEMEYGIPYVIVTDTVTGNKVGKLMNNITTVLGMCCITVSVASDWLPENILEEHLVHLYE